jgi:hypothetical protein
MIRGDLGLYGERLAVVLGFCTLGFFAALGFTCRSFLPLARKLGLNGLIESKPYKKLFSFHSFFWYGFFLLLVLHMMTGIMHTELPKTGDPNASIHLAILIMAGSVLFSLGFTFSTCRSFIGIFHLVGKDPLKGWFKSYYNVHSYIWILLLLALIGHLVASYLHIGFWPTAID